MLKPKQTVSSSFSSFKLVLVAGPEIKVKNSTPVLIPCVIHSSGHLEKLLANKKLETDKKNEYESVIQKVCYYFYCWLWQSHCS